MSTYNNLFILSVSVIWDLRRDHKHIYSMYVHSMHANLRRSHTVVLITTKLQEFRMNNPGRSEDRGRKLTDQGGKPFTHPSFQKEPLADIGSRQTQTHAHTNPCLSRSDWTRAITLSAQIAWLHMVPSKAFSFLSKSMSPFFCKNQCGK